jgi:hypothetical protein
MVEVGITCVMCRREIAVSVRFEDLVRFHQGEKVQDAFPYLSRDQRELFLTQICGSCFETLEEDEEE